MSGVKNIIQQQGRGKTIPTNEQYRSVGVVTSKKSGKAPRPANLPKKK